jgi:hypothetical protein
LFRRAVSAGAFPEAEQLLVRYRQEVEASWKAATSASERSAIAADVTALLEWARVTTLSARAHAQSKLVLLGRVSAYGRSVRKDELFNLNA